MYNLLSSTNVCTHETITRGKIVNVYISTKILLMPLYPLSLSPSPLLFTPSLSNHDLLSLIID